MSKRMIDRLFAEGAWRRDVRDHSLHPWSVHEMANPRTGRSYLADAEVLLVDNVCRFLYEDSPKDVWEIDDFSNCAPPFPVVWMETRAPMFVQTERARTRWDAEYAWAALFIAHHCATVLDMPEIGEGATQGLAAMREQQERAVCLAFARHGLAIPREEPPTAEAKAAYLASLPPAVHDELQRYSALAHADERLMLAAMPPEAYWLYTVSLFLQRTSHDRIVGPVLYGNFLVTQSGRMLPMPSRYSDTQQGQWAIEYGEYLSQEEREEWLSLGRVRLYPMWLALSFLHCKNVTLATEDPCHSRKPPRKGEACRRLHYKVLNIQPMQEVLRREGGQAQHGLKKALHICRGYFKDYRERSLFGKYQGLFWWEAHVRGASTHGVVAKDYRVQPPLQPPGDCGLLLERRSYK
jgi:hypothetical protein